MTNLGPAGPQLCCAFDLMRLSKPSTGQAAASAPAATPNPLDNDPDAVAVEVRTGGQVVYEQHGADVSRRDDGVASSKLRDRLRGAVRKFLIPSNFPTAVTEDYAPFRRWAAVQHFAGAGVDFFAMQGVLAGLGVQLSSPLVGTISYVGKDGLNGLGQMVGGALAKKADIDPRTWYARSEYMNAVSSALQSTLIIAPHLFLLTAPLTNGVKAFASAVNGAATANIDNHQSLGQNVGEMRAKNGNQNMLAGAVGSALAVGLSVAGQPLLGPWTSMGLAAGFMGLQMFAAHKAADALQMNDVTDSRLRRLVRAMVAGSPVMGPEQLDDTKIRVPRAHPDPELGVGLQDIVKDGPGFDRLRAIYGKDRYLLDYDGKKIRVALHPTSTAEDQARAVFQAQLLAELVESPGYAKVMSGLNDRESQLKAVELSYAATPGTLAPMLAQMHSLGWATSRITFGADNVRVRWRPGSDAPPSPMSLEDFRALLK